MTTKGYEITGADPSHLGLLSECLSRVGHDGFNQSFLALTQALVGADQCMIFSYRDKGIGCYLSYNTRPKGSARALAANYLKVGHKSDPLAPDIKRLKGSDGIELVPFDKLEPRMSAEYRAMFFDQPGIKDKTTLIARRGPLCLGVNFYWFVENTLPEGRIPAESSDWWEIIGHIALLHYSDQLPPALRSPLLSLSAREREICELMLKGMTTDAIAWELQLQPSTVATFRKRAYAKLGLNSKSALFALCYSQTTT